jgi:hypothetical protein
MGMVWDHDGVTLRAPVRFARRLRAGAAVLLVATGLGSAALIDAARPPEALRGWSSCIADPSASVCAELRPDWMRWSFEEDGYVAARMCSLRSSAHNGALPDYLPSRLGEAQLGLASVENLRFLQLISGQEGACEVPDVEPISASLRALQRTGATPSEIDAAVLGQALTEELMLLELERVILVDRAVRSDFLDQARFASESWRHRLFAQTLWLWLPALCAIWMVVLVGVRRLLRASRPLHVRVGSGGIQLDGREIPRSAIAWIALDGQRLRIERWSGPALLSRPLPPEAIEHADEICAAIHLPDVLEAPRPVPVALRALRASG